MKLVKDRVEQFNKKITKHSLTLMKSKIDYTIDLKKNGFAKEYGYSEQVAEQLKLHNSFLLNTLESYQEFLQNHYSNSISILTSKIALGSTKFIKKDFYVFNSLGCCHSAMGKNNLAINYFRKALSES